jgi:peroxiredoxin
MAVTSTMLPLGTEAPNFELPDFDGETHRLGDFADAPVLVVAFICNHCPYVVHIREQWSRVAGELQDRGVAVAAIAANDVDSHPQDGPKGMAEEAREYGYTFPYLYDETQQVARAYRAACTPDFYVFDADRKLAYRGQFDDGRPSNDTPVTGADLVAAVDAVLAGEPAPEDQKPSMGCNIKWKPGNEPDYF